MNAHREAQPRAARHRARPSLETMEERLLLAATKLPAGLQGQLLRSVRAAARTAPVSPGGAVSAWPAQLPVSGANLALRPNFGSVSGRLPVDGIRSGAVPSEARVCHGTADRGGEPGPAGGRHD